jgi:hypothetical protein
MNQRVFDMARQSGATDEKGSRAEHVFCFTKDELKGFTQTIIQDILTVVKSEHKLALEFQWDADDTAIAIRDAIKKRFGVAE